MANGATTVGAVSYDVKVDTSGLDKGLKDADSKVKSGANKLGVSFSKIGDIAKKAAKIAVASIAAVGVAAIKMGKDSLEAYNTQAESLAKLEQSAKNQNWYKGATDDLMKYNAELQKIGIIGDEVNAAGQAQLGTFGLSAEAVKALTPAMDDLIAATSGYGTTTDNATQMANLMGKVMTGNVGALTRYGVTLSDNQKKLLENGNEMEKAAVLAEVLKQNYGGFNEKLAQTPQGKVKQLANNFGDLKETVGALLTGKGSVEDFTGTLELVMNDVIGVVEAFLPNITKTLQGVIPAIAKALPGLLNSLMPVISTLLDSLISLLPPLISSVLPALAKVLIDATMSLVDYLPEITQALLDMFLTVTMALIDNLPNILDSIVEAIMGIVEVLTQPTNLQKLLQATLKLFMALVNTIPQIVVTLVDALPQIITNIVSFLTDPANISMLIGAAIELFFGLVKAVPQILGALLGAFGTLVGNLWNGIKGMFGQFAANFGGFITDIFKGAINGVIGFIEGFINTPISILNGFIGLINGAFGFIGVNLGKIDTVKLPRLASGGIVPATKGGQVIMAGEAGEDEWVVPESKMASLIEKLNTNSGDNGSGATFNFTFNGIVGTKSELRQCAITFHNAYEEVKKARMAA